VEFVHPFRQIDGRHFESDRLGAFGGGRAGQVLPHSEEGVYGPLCENRQKSNCSVCLPSSADALSTYVQIRIVLITGNLH
jgi:hypothetical protein